MHCTNCGSLIKSGWRFCQSCGTAVQFDGAPAETLPAEHHGPTTEADRELIDERNFVCKPVPYWITIALFIAGLVFISGLDKLDYLRGYFLVSHVATVIPMVLALARARDAGYSFVWGFFSLPLFVTPELVTNSAIATYEWWWPWSLVAILMIPSIVLGLPKSSHPGKNWV